MIFLTLEADNLDTLLVLKLAGYVLMHTTFIRLFLVSHSLGSNFSLTAATPVWTEWSTGHE